MLLGVLEHGDDPTAFTAFSQMEPEEISSELRSKVEDLRVSRVSDQLASMEVFKVLETTSFDEGFPGSTKIRQLVDQNLVASMNSLVESPSTGADFGVACESSTAPATCQLCRLKNSSTNSERSSSTKTMTTSRRPYAKLLMSSCVGGLNLHGQQGSLRLDPRRPARRMREPKRRRKKRRLPRKRKQQKTVRGVLPVASTSAWQGSTQTRRFVVVDASTTNAMETSAREHARLIAPGLTKQDNLAASQNARLVAAVNR
jgi:hypothetical protein